MVLLEANERRAQFLDRRDDTSHVGCKNVSAWCTTGPRFVVVTLLRYQGAFDGVVARSVWATRPVVAEYAAPFLLESGRTA